MCGEGCGRVYGVNGEVCWRVGKGCGERNERVVGKCVRVWGPNTLLPISPPSPYLFLHLPLPPPHPNTLSYTSSHSSSHIFSSSPHTPTHFPTIPTSPLTFSKSGEVTMRQSFCARSVWQSYWQPSALTFPIHTGTLNLTKRAC